MSLEKVYGKVPREVLWWVMEKADEKVQTTNL